MSLFEFKLGSQLGFIQKSSFSKLNPPYGVKNRVVTLDAIFTQVSLKAAHVLYILFIMSYLVIK